jgi:hypothetical protein
MSLLRHLRVIKSITLMTQMSQYYRTKESQYFYRSVTACHKVSQKVSQKMSQKSVAKTVTKSVTKSVIKGVTLIFSFQT